MYFVVRVKTLSLINTLMSTNIFYGLMVEAGVTPVITYSSSSDSDVPYPASKSLILEEDVLLIPVVVILSFT